MDTKALSLMMNDPRLALQSLLAPPHDPRTRTGFAVARGPVGLVEWALPVLATNLTGGLPLLWIDAAGRFDPRGLIQAATAWGIDKFFFLNRVQVARPETLEQMERLLLSELAPRPEGGQPVVIADPLSLWENRFMEEEEKQEHLLRFEDALTTLSNRCLILHEERPGGFAATTQRLYGQAPRRARLTLAEGHWEVTELSERLKPLVRFLV